MQMARSEWLKGNPKVGLVKVYQLVPIVTRTPGPQVGLYKAHSGIKWWISEKLEPRIPPCVNLAIVVVWGCHSGHPDPCQSKDPHVSKLTHTRQSSPARQLTHTRQRSPAR